MTTNPTPADLAARCDELEAVVERMTPAKWYVVEPPWRQRDGGTYVVAGSNDPHVGKPVVDGIEIMEWPADEDPDYSQSDADLYGIVALRNTALPLIRQLRERLAAVEGELCKLAKFKAYVHKRLDDADVPNHPNPKTHDGCRIGARLDWCEANRKALVNQINLLTHKVITCGIAASHPDAELTRRLKCYAEDWNSPQAEEVRALRAERDEIKQQLAVQDDAYKLLYDRVLDAQKLREENGRLRAALQEICDMQAREFTGIPADFQQQIDACPECQQYKGHPIQRGICDKHREPLWEQESHYKRENGVGMRYRMRDVARNTLAATPGKADTPAKAD